MTAEAVEAPYETSDDPVFNVPVYTANNQPSLAERIACSIRTEQEHAQPLPVPGEHPQRWLGLQ